jgi:glycosyltransferase involved in cell wall biosynthesis
MRDVKLQVLMVTYNHEAYVEQAVRSVMMQETDFAVELFVGDDASQDRTPAILQALQAEHPGRIRLFLRPQNLGFVANFIDIYHRASSPFCAILEGDDYWIAADKLQRQVQYLEDDPACRVVYHTACIQMEDKRDFGISMIGDTRHEVHGLERVIGGTYQVPTGSLVFRHPPQTLPGWFSGFRTSLDWPFVTWLLMQGGTIRALESDAPMSVYRLHGGGVTIQWDDISGETEAHMRGRLADVMLVRKHLPRRDRSKLRFRLWTAHHTLLHYYVRAGRWRAAWRHLPSALYHLPRHTPYYWSRQYQTIRLVLFPGYSFAHLLRRLRPRKLD